MLPSIPTKHLEQLSNFNNRKMTNSWIKLTTQDVYSPHRHNTEYQKKSQKTSKNNNKHMENEKQCLVPFFSFCIQHGILNTVQALFFIFLTKYEVVKKWEALSETNDHRVSRYRAWCRRLGTIHWWRCLCVESTMDSDQCRLFRWHHVHCTCHGRELCQQETLQQVVVDACRNIWRVV